MKVALYGNVCNNYYTLAKALRSKLNIDAHLYLNHKADIQNRPESDDPSLKDNYPDWIHLSKKWDYIPMLTRYDRTFVKELNKYDVVFLSQFGVTLAPFIKSKKIFYVTGGDLTQTPFPRKFAHKYPNPFLRLIWEYVGFMQRRGIRSMDRILTQPFFPFVNALEELKIKPSQVSKCYFPILLDTRIFTRNDHAMRDIDPYNKALLAPFNFIILHPSRINLDQSRGSIDSGQWKGNDNLFKALSICIRKYKIDDLCVAMPERIFSPDIGKAKKIISDLGIESNVVWLRPPNPEGFPRRQLMNFYSISDLVADEFATGWFGSVVVEGMACSKPTFCYVDEKVMNQLYPWHPIVSAKEPEAIAEHIASFYFDREKKEQHGELSRKWVKEFHSLMNGTEIYINNFRNDLKDVFNLT
jgi:glycosyltransferase involved in cell wall biosynthesis